MVPVSLLRRISTTHLLLLCAGIVAVVAGGTALAIAAGSGGPKPPSRPLAVAVRDALAAPAPQGVTARIKFTNHLVDSAGIQGSNPILSGASGRLWATPNGRVRIELQSSRGDAQLVSDGKTFWAWDGSSRTVYKGQLPQHRHTGRAEKAEKLPSIQQIEGAIARFGQHASLSGATPSNVGGSPAYTVRAAPRKDGGLLGGVAVAWDAAHGAPLRFAVYAKGQASPVLELAVTDISYGPVPAGDFAVSPPAGAKTVDVSPAKGDGASKHAAKGKEIVGLAAVQSAVRFKLAAPGSLAGRARQEVRLLGSRRENPIALVTYGQGLGGIAVLEQAPGAARHAGSAPGAGPADRAQLPTVSIGAVKGQELQTPLGTVIRFERGGVAYTVLGSVTRAAAEAAARGL
jgi:outer membrane lipoprotein-sorting protein